eukprot:1134909-Rhodomonas_salina.1
MIGQALKKSAGFVTRVTCQLDTNSSSPDRRFGTEQGRWMRYKTAQLLYSMQTEQGCRYSYYVLGCYGGGYVILSRMQ